MGLQVLATDLLYALDPQRLASLLGNVIGKAPQDRERRKQQQQLEELRHFMIPLSQVLLAHGATFTRRLVDVESQFRAVTVAIGATKEQWNKDGLSRSYARQYQEAIADFDFALRLDPKDVIAFRNRESAYEMINANLRKSTPSRFDVKEANLIGAEVAQKQLEKDRPLQSATIHVEAGSLQKLKDAPQQPHPSMPPQSVMYQFVPQYAALRRCVELS